MLKYVVLFSCIFLVLKTSGQQTEDGETQSTTLTSDVLTSDPSTTVPVRFRTPYEHLCLYYQCECPSNISKIHKRLKCQNKFIKTLPINLQIPDFITIVSFRDNQLTMFIADDLDLNTHLVELDLAHNYISILSMNAFQNLKNLQIIDLSHNKLRVIGSSSFAGLPSLQSLNLAHNNISHFYPNIFDGVPELKKLDLSYNPLTFYEIGMFNYLPNLEQLNLDYVGMMLLPKDIFKTNSNLKILTLTGNNLKVVPYQVLSQLTSLTSLDLSYNSIKEIGSTAFPRLPNLNILSLNNLQDLYEIREHAFEFLPTLKVLHCSYNPKLSLIHENAFKDRELRQVVRLNLLYLQHNDIESISKDLIAWDEPYYMDLSGNPWRCDCNIQWMTHLDTKHEMKEQLRCYQPKNLEGKFITELDENSMVCDGTLRRWVFYMLCLFLALATTLLMGVVLLTFLRYGCLKRMNKDEQYQYKPVVNKSPTVIVDNQIADNGL